MNKQVSYGSVCSGIEAASVAWHCLGWRPAWFAEIEKFPSAVLAYRWPDVTNLGDMTQIAAAIRAGKIDAPDVLVGGTPCQAFSVAGLRNGLADERGQLTLAFVDLVNAIDEKRSEQGKSPVIVVWENVPGVFSSKDNAFGCFLAGLAGESCALESPGKRWANAGYVLGPERAIAWRVLDAQFFGVAQRRRRVFVVATARGDIDPAKILFESEGLRRNSPPGREKAKAVAALTSNGIGVCGADDNQAQAGHLIPECVTGDISHTLKAEGFDGSEDGTGRGTPIIAMAHGQGGAEIKTDDTAPTLTCNHEAPIVFSSNGHASFTTGVGALRAKPGADHETLAVHGTQDPDTLRNMAHTLGRNHGQENAVIAFSSKDSGHDAKDEISPTLRAGNSSDSNQNAGAPPAIVYSFAENTRGEVRFQDGDGQITGPLAAGGGKPGQGYPAIAYAFKGGQGAKAGGIGYAEEQAPTLTSASSGSNLAPTVMKGMAVRRLTPVECERLQGFPDNHTLIPTTKRKQLTAEEYAYLRHHRPELTAEQAYRLAADGPRYKAIGNSMAVPVMRWIGSRIQEALHA
jgi:DNA (cytosine-5)-methyltransferase 1